MSTHEEPELLEHLGSFISARRRRRIEEILAQRTRRITLVLDDVYQPHNASAVLRTCECFGIQDVYAVERTNTYEINEAVALGAAKWLTLHRHRDQAACFAELRSRDYRLVAATPHAADCTLAELRVDMPSALLLGTEETGLSREALEAADVRVCVPIWGFTESFNVSVCAALMLQDLVRKLRVGDVDWVLSPMELRALRLAWYRRSIRGVELIEQRFRRERRL